MPPGANGQNGKIRLKFATMKKRGNCRRLFAMVAAHRYITTAQGVVVTSGRAVVQHRRDRAQSIL